MSFNSKSFRVLALIFLVTNVFKLQSQNTLDVTEQTLKIGGFKEEELYFGFAEGDKIVFSFEEADQKEMKEIEIVEYPNNSKFSDYKTKAIPSKTITATKQSAYIFRFKNGALSGRICKIKIQRIPASAEKNNFNTTVNWEDKQETTYNTYTKNVIVGYDTTYLQKSKKVLVKTEQREELLFDKQQRVHSTSNSNGNKTALFFTLPENQITAYKTSKVIAWAYWVGVGEEANAAWKQNTQAISTLVKGAATYFTSPLGALAVGAITDLAIPKIGEDVSYGIADNANKDLFMSNMPYRIYDQGKGVAGYRKFFDQGLCNGSYYVLLSNDNVMQGIDVTVKVITILEVKTYEEQAYTEMQVAPRYELKTFKDPVIRTTRVPVVGG